MSGVDVEEISKELKELKSKLEAYTKAYSKNAGNESAQETSLAALVNYLVAERERTNKMLEGVMERIKMLESELESEDEAIGEQESTQAIESPFAGVKEIPLSATDAKVIEYIQTKGMVCASDLQNYMHYKGKNAASARLNLLYKQGILDRFQMGHKVYYRYNAGKANQILITPPQ